MSEQRPSPGRSDAPAASDKFTYLIRSRKFWAAIVAITFIVLGPRAGVEQTEITGAVLTIVAYIMGTALEDGLSD